MRSQGTLRLRQVTATKSKANYHLLLGSRLGHNMPLLRNLPWLPLSLKRNPLPFPLGPCDWPRPPLQRFHQQLSGGPPAPCVRACPAVLGQAGTPGHSQGPHCALASPHGPLSFALPASSSLSSFRPELVTQVAPYQHLPPLVPGISFSDTC